MATLVPVAMLPVLCMNARPVHSCHRDRLIVAFTERLSAELLHLSHFDESIIGYASDL
jgi:hypothetical protein